MPYKSKIKTTLKLWCPECDHKWLYVYNQKSEPPCPKCGFTEVEEK